MPIYLSEVEASKALGKFFQPEQDNVYASGYYQFKGILYRTKNLDFKGAISITEDELRNLVENFEEKYSDDPEALEILEAKKLHDLLDQVKDISDYDTKTSILAENFPISRLNKAIVTYATNICLFWCSSCKDMYFEDEIGTDSHFKYPKCPNCSRQVQQTPVWVMKTDNERRPTPVTPFPVWITKYDTSEAWNAWRQHRHMRCPDCGNGLLRKYVILDSARVMASSRIVCAQCGTQHSLFSRNYSLTAGTEHLTKPLLAPTYSSGSVQLKRQDLLAKLSGDSILDTGQIEEFSFAPSIRVKEVLLGFWYGLHVTRIYKAKRSGITISTGGLYLRLKEPYFAKALSFMKEAYKEHTEYPALLGAIQPTGRDFKHLTLHSLGHALMSGLPQTTGVSLDSFSYLYDFTKNAVLVYERAPGGLGACSVLTENDEISGDPVLLDYLARLMENLGNCTCDDRCKYCIALMGCSEFNANLNRFSIGALFKIAPEDMTWGF